VWSLASACSYSIVRHGEINQNAAAKIEHGIEDVRGLKFRTPVPMEVKSAEELRQYLQAELARQYTPEQVRGLQRVYERLGLLAPGVDLGEALVKLYTAQIAGFYDPQVGTLFLVPSGLPPAGWTVNMMQFVLQRDLVNEMLLAHELTHALQDQNFSTLTAADDPSNDDRALAIHAVVEGDATLAGFAYLFGGLPENSVLDLVDRLGAVPAELEKTLPDTPPVLRDSLVFQYSEGAKFVALAYLRGGWPAVNTLLANPPTSTEQVLWPDKFFGQRQPPTLVHLDGLDDYRKPDDWKLIEENTIGALTVRILVESFLGPERAVQVALDVTARRVGKRPASCWLASSSSHGAGCSSNRLDCSAIAVLLDADGTIFGNYKLRAILKSFEPPGDAPESWLHFFPDFNSFAPNLQVE
jgi:hypothetical protein